MPSGALHVASEGKALCAAAQVSSWLRLRGCNLSPSSCASGTLWHVNDYATDNIPTQPLTHIPSCCLPAGVGPAMANPGYREYAPYPGPVRTSSTAGPLAVPSILQPAAAAATAGAGAGTRAGGSGIHSILQSAADLAIGAGALGLGAGPPGPREVPEQLAGRSSSVGRGVMIRGRQSSSGIGGATPVRGGGQTPGGGGVSAGRLQPHDGGSPGGEEKWWGTPGGGKPGWK